MQERPRSEQSEREETGVVDEKAELAAGGEECFVLKHIQRPAQRGRGGEWPPSWPDKDHVNFPGVVLGQVCSGA